MLTDFFELNPPTVLDPGLTTTSSSADHITHFARAVGLEVTLSSYGLLEDLLLRARRVGSPGGRVEIGRSPLPSPISSTVADSVPPQSKNSIPTLSDFTAAAASVDTVRLGGSED